MLKSRQRYISKELTHFVGKGQDAESQYGLLVKILRAGLLSHSPHSPLKISLGVNESAKISQNEMYSPQTVCFCDIPVEDLTLHVRKYSRFGLSFDKDFIAQQGGAPVYYIPIKAKAPEAGFNFKDINKGEYFDTMLKQYRNLFELLIIATIPYDGIQSKHLPPLGAPDTPQNLQELLRDFPLVVLDLRWFFDFSIFSYVKAFNHCLPEDHEENYYFEREWRVVGDVQFNIEDVKRVLIPKEYAKQFRQDCPEYYGQITFVE